jgi:hypothetical protein
MLAVNVLMFDSSVAILDKRLDWSQNWSGYCGKEKNVYPISFQTPYL